jgi:hypothetical protein
MLTINEDQIDALWKIGDVALYLSVSARTVEKQRSDPTCQGWVRPAPQSKSTV